MLEKKLLKFFNHKNKHFNELDGKERGIVLGEAYEVYAITKIIANCHNPNVKFLTPHFHCQDKKKKYYSKTYIENDELYYFFEFEGNKYPLCEFDLIGINMKQKTLYYYEITYSKQNNKGKQIERAYQFTQKIFPKHYKKKYFLVSPEKTKTKNHNFKSLKVPGNIENKIKKHEEEKNFVLELKNHIKKHKIFCIEIFDQKVKQYNYLEELYYFCKNNYQKLQNGNLEDIKRIKKNYIIERVYNLETINDQEFSAFNIEKEGLKQDTFFVDEKNHKIIKNDKDVPKFKKTYMEVWGLRKLIKEKNNK